MTHVRGSAIGAMCHNESVAVSRRHSCIHSHKCIHSLSLSLSLSFRCGPNPNPRTLTEFDPRIGHVNNSLLTLTPVVVSCCLCRTRPAVATMWQLAAEHQGDMSRIVLHVCMLSTRAKDAGARVVWCLQCRPPRKGRHCILWARQVRRYAAAGAVGVRRSVRAGAGV